ncbi:MAG: DUF1329 domain-containing protein [Deltaproteobacteria bacterium]|nr:MAG: DUF1329 domain-containing protein [Deltaproteobacteria bacterium]
MRPRTAAIAWTALGGLLLAVPHLAADVRPGEVLAKGDIPRLGTLVSPSIEWILRRGATMKIAEPRPVGWPKAYQEATEKYASQVQLAADGLTILHYVAGQPFPNLQLADPAIGVKIMWNYEYRPYPGTDDFVEYDFPTYSASLNTGAPMTIERDLRIGEARRLYYNGRLVVPPTPEMPNGSGLRFQEFVGPVLAPFDLKGIGLITYRFIDPGQQDMSFLYLPALRRVRRLSTAQRSDALLGTDADPDSFWGYGGHIAWMQWRFLGEREMLGVLHGEHYPIQRCPGAADFMFCDAWEKRTVYAIEGISKLAQYAYGKRVIYVDKQAMVVAYEDIFDKAGELWKVWIDNHQFRDQAYPGARKYPEEQDFYAGLLMLDMQLEHATYVPHPAVEGHEGWFFNEGPNARTDASGAGSVPETFTVGSLVERGH